MKAREYLGQLDTIDSIIKEKLFEANKWREIAMSTGGHEANPDKVQTSPKPDKMSRAAVYAVTYENEAEELMDLRYKIVSQIDGIEDFDARDILVQRYVYQKSITKIANEKHYTPRNAYKLINAAEDTFDQKYAKTY